MPLLRALGKLADFVVRTLWVILRAVARSVVGVKRLLAAMHRLRGRGSDGSLATARLFDVHAVTLSADLALLAAWWFSPVEVGRPAGIVALAGSIVLASASVLAIRRVPGVSRAVIGLGLVLRGLLTVVAAQWLAGNLALLLVLLALVAPQWGVHLVTLLRSGAGGRRLAVPLLATAYAVLGCLIVVVPALVLGWLHPAGPLWLAAALLTFSALLALRVPSDAGLGETQTDEPPPRPVSARQRSRHESANADPEPGPGPSRPGSTRPGSTRAGSTRAGSTRAGSTGAASPSRQAVPPQSAADGAPDGFHVYRPSTLDDA